MKTAIEKIGGNYKVTFTHGVQTFTLDYSGAKKECQWYKDRLDECFKSFASQQQPSREKIREATEEAYDKWIRLENENVTYLGELIAIELSELSEEAPFDKNDDRCNVCGFINCVCGIE